MNALKNFSHLVILALLAVAGLLFSVKAVAAATLLPAVLFWAWFAGYAAATSWIQRQFSSPLAALGTHGAVWVVLSVLPRVAPFSALRLGLDFLS